ncbi:unannotated protein [freshwater metagenome]|uniref:Unannotated protein n=1 Tax=freshwater metagenome TaxID=449393 RepID=A0A6J6BZW7_9ZZZZ|nr:hypothetical protein [Actinomycetota bacterium]MSY79301.1 hypothetical protein [Actinomycetota bacterium]MTA63949.1 hypothetical protein [Actinomycetota bacterium]
MAEPDSTAVSQSTAQPKPNAGFSPEAMIERFAERASSVKRRNIPPVEGEARKDFIRQAEADFRDFAMIADAVASLEDGVLVLRVDLRPEAERG